MSRTRRWQVATWVLGAVVAAGVCGSLLAIPIQVTDSLIPMLQALDGRSAVAALVASADAAVYLRPLRIAQIQALMNTAHGHYFLVFKSVHVALVLACIALFLAAARVRTWRDAAAAALGLAVLTGLHTFLGTVWEAYPINHFLEVVVACLLAFVLAQSRGGWWVDAAAGVVFVAASLTLESGLLVWVVVVAARLTGLRGVSRAGVAVVTALLVGYLALRFGYFATGMPTLVERSTGFGLRTLDPPELVARFGAHPLGLYAYNVMASLLSVLASQPRAGVWTLLAAFRDGRPVLGTLVNVVSSVATTSAIVWFAVRRRAAWAAGQFERDDQAVLVAAAVLLANAVLSYGYTKDEIMSPAGTFYALASAAVLGRLAGMMDEHLTRQASRLALVLLLAVASAGWWLRAVGLHYHMHQIAMHVRNEWVHVDNWLTAQGAAPTTPEGRALVDQLRREAVDHAVANPYFLALEGTVLFP